MTLKKYIQMNASWNIFWKWYLECYRGTYSGDLLTIHHVSLYTITEYITLWVFLDIYLQYIAQLCYVIYSIVYRHEYISEYLSTDRVNNLFSNIFAEHRCVLSIKYPCNNHRNIHIVIIPRYIQTIHRSIKLRDLFHVYHINIFRNIFPRIEPTTYTKVYLKSISMYFSIKYPCDSFRLYHKLVR